LIIRSAEGENGLSDDITQVSQQHYFTLEDAQEVAFTTTHKTSNALKTEIEAYIRATFKQDGQIMVAIAKCESGLRPEAVNWGDAKITGLPSQGIFQINAPYNEALFDWKYNVDVAYKDFYLKRGIQPWSCAKILGFR